MRNFTFTMTLSMIIISAAYSIDHMNPGSSPRNPEPYCKGIPGGVGYVIEADSSHEFDVLDYHLLLYPYLDGEYLTAANIITLAPETASLTHIELNAEDLLIDSVYAYWGTLSYSYEADILDISLGQAFQPGDTIAINIEYRAPVYDDPYEKGFHRTSGDYTYTVAEPIGARRWFPCYDFPFDKALVHSELHVPSGYKAAGNGELTEVQHLTLEDVFFWSDDAPKTTYLTSLACGPYVEINDLAPGNIPLLYLVYPEDSADAVYDFEHTADMIDFFSQTFGDFPFQMYGMAEAHLYGGWGAMENQNMTTYGYHLITGDRYWENVVSHELSHMWWGDALTPLTFADIWLNEGFAIYSEALYIESRYDTLPEYMENIAESFFADYNNGNQYPIYDPPEEYLFGTAVYLKGAWIQHMLRTIIGDAAFFEATQNYVDTYKYGNVITAEYQAEMEAFSGEDLDWFFDEWLLYPGFPKYDYQWSVVPAGQNYQVNLEIQQVQTGSTIFAMPLELYFSDGQNDTTLTIWNELENEQYALEVNFHPAQFVLDPENKILKWDMPNKVSDAGTNAPAVFKLYQNYPNPFNAKTVISFQLQAAGVFSLDIFDITGRSVGAKNLSPLQNQYLSSGYHEIVWDASGVASGVYLVRLEALSGAETRQHGVVKTILVK